MTKILTFCVTDEFHGKRLDATLSALCPDRSRSVITQFIQNGMVELDGKKVLVMSPQDVVVKNIYEPGGNITLAILSLFSKYAILSVV